MTESDGHTEGYRRALDRWTSASDAELRRQLAFYENVTRDDTSQESSAYDTTERPGDIYPTLHSEPWFDAWDNRDAINTLLSMRAAVAADAVDSASPPEAPIDPDIKQLIEQTGSYDDGHNFGWRAKTAPPDPPAAAPTTDPAPTTEPVPHIEPVSGAAWDAAFAPDLTLGQGATPIGQVPGQRAPVTPDADQPTEHYYKALQRWQFASTEQLKYQLDELQSDFHWIRDGEAGSYSGALADPKNKQDEIKAIEEIVAKRNASASMRAAMAPEYTPGAPEAPVDPDIKQLIEQTGSYDDGHNFGWRAKNAEPDPPSAPAETTEQLSGVETGPIFNPNTIIGTGVAPIGQIPDQRLPWLSHVGQHTEQYQNYVELWKDAPTPRLLELLALLNETIDRSYIGGDLGDEPGADRSMLPIQPGDAYPEPRSEFALNLRDQHEALVDLLTERGVALPDPSVFPEVSFAVGSPAVATAAVDTAAVDSVAVDATAVDSGGATEVSAGSGSGGGFLGPVRGLGWQLGAVIVVLIVLLIVVVIVVAGGGGGTKQVASSSTSRPTPTPTPTNQTGPSGAVAVVPAQPTENVAPTSAVAQVAAQPSDTSAAQPTEAVAVEPTAAAQPTAAARPTLGTPTPIKPTASKAPPTAAAAPAAAAVVVKDNEDKFLGDPCGKGPLDLRWVISGVPAGTKVIVDFTGPGLPPSQMFTTAADGSFGEMLSIGGNGVRTTHIESVGGKSPPPANDNNSSSVTGCPQTVG